MDEESVRAHVWVTGKVQGVFFRSETTQLARVNGIKGWVRNLRDGRLEAVFEGERDVVETMIGWCGRGPVLARVDDVEVVWEAPQNEMTFTGG